MRLTVDILRECYRAAEWCGNFKRFKQMFPDGVEVTEDNCIRIAGEFDWLSVAACLIVRPIAPSVERTILSVTVCMLSWAASAMTWSFR